MSETKDRIRRQVKPLSWDMTVWKLFPNILEKVGGVYRPIIGAVYHQTIQNIMARFLRMTVSNVIWHDKLLPTLSFVLTLSLRRINRLKLSCSVIHRLIYVYRYRYIDSIFLSRPNEMPIQRARTYRKVLPSSLNYTRFHSSRFLLLCLLLYVYLSRENPSRTNSTRYRCIIAGSTENKRVTNILEGQTATKSNRPISLIRRQIIRSESREDVSAPRPYTNRYSYKYTRTAESRITRILEYGDKRAGNLHISLLTPNIIRKILRKNSSNGMWT